MVRICTGELHGIESVLAEENRVECAASCMLASARAVGVAFSRD